MLDMVEVAWNDVLSNLIQTGLTASVVALVLLLLRKVMKKRYPARVVCIVWAILAIRLIIPVQLTLPDPPVQVTPRTTYISNVTLDAETIERAELPVYERDGEITTQRWVTNDEVQALREAAGGPGSFSIFDFGQILSLLWIAGAVLFVCWQIYRYVPYRYVLQNSSHPVERDTLRAVFEEQKRSLGIARDIPLRVSPAADCPMLVGFIKPTLYLPDEALDASDAAFIFRHELTHYKRGDLWLKLALVAARAMHWFNPLVHLMARFAQEDIELACDDAVVRGMDVDARRAYGETILRSVEAQVKRRALVSCFTGDKEGLMRRFEGLFDKNVKRRGVALVVAVAVMIGTLGCAVSVGESNSKPDEEARRALAEAWAQRTESLGYTVKLDGEDTAVLYDVQCDNLPDEIVPYRTGEKLVFEMGADGWQVAKAETVAPDGVTTLDEFRLLYENDLGLPDPIAAGDMVLTEEQQQKWSNPVDAATDLLHLQATGTMGGSSADRTMGDDIVDTTFIFDDHSEVVITMVRQFDAGWLPQDFTYDGGKNARTAADLAGQYARGVTHKSGQYIYPILTAQKQQEFRTAQQIPGGGFSWKYGGSSPSYRGYTLVPTSGGEYIAVFQMYGGGVEDMRSAFLITTAQADGRRVIDRVTEVAVSNYTKSDLFRLYYDSGLPWPTIPEGADSFNGASLDTLTRVRDAVETVFGYFGENVEHIEGDQHLYTLESWFKSEVISEGETDAVVRLTFVDNSPSVDVRMRKTDGYWLPVGLAGQPAEGFSATVNDEALPTGTTVQQAVQTAAGELPLLRAGDQIELLFDPAPDGEVTIEDAVIRRDGTLQYDDGVTERSTFSYTGNVASMSYTYPVEHLMAEALSGTMNAVVYRGVTLTYTANGTDYTAAFAFRLADEGVVSVDYTITSTEYHNDTYGYTLTLPDCFVGQGYAKETSDSTVQFGLQNALPGYSDDPTDGGTVMGLYVQATASLKAQFGEDWQAGYPVPCKELAERNGLTYYLAFASDVQYDPSDEEITAAYTEMSAAAYAMGADAISFDGQNDAQAGREQQQVLHDLGEQYAYMENQLLSGGLPIDLVTVEPNLTDGSCLLVVRYMGQAGDYYFTTAQRLWYEGTDSVTPDRTEALVNTSGGVRSLEEFRYAFPYEQGFPVFDEAGLESLSEMAAKPASLENPDLSTPEACADDSEMGLTYRWDDGEMTIRMQRVQLSESSPVLWLPFGYDGWQPQYLPYLLVLARMMDYYPYRTTVDLLQALEMGWADGAYAEAVFAELDKRWQQDADAVESAVAGFGTGVQELWASHKGTNPEIFNA